VRDTTCTFSKYMGAGEKMGTGNPKTSKQCNLARLVSLADSTQMMRSDADSQSQRLGSLPEAWRERHRT
jgi:hypothetical protein